MGRSPDPDFVSSDIPVQDLPRCNKSNCGALLRPDIVWFGESLNSQVLDRVSKLISFENLKIFILHRNNNNK